MNEVSNMSFRPSDYEVISGRRILHLKSGSAFKFTTGRRLTLVEKRKLDIETQCKIEEGARRALDRWPRGSISW
jgi:hypothetical protein